MPAAPGRPRSESSRTAILEAAIALTREVGYDALGMEAIAARAGVGKATVYRWWSSKELLVAEAIGRIVRGIPEPDTGTVEGDVLYLMQRTTGMYRDPATGPLLSGLVAAMARSDVVADAVRVGFVTPRRELLRAAIRRGVRRGELRRGLDIDVVLDMLSGPAFFRYLMLGQPIDDRYARGVVKVLLRGITAS
jgi:AcrR family transcriptional regulator